MAASGSTSGLRPANPRLVQVVPVGEVAERGVTGDHLAAAASGEAASEVGVEGVEVGHEGPRVGAVGGGVRRVAPREVVAQEGGDVREPAGVEPEVRVDPSSSCSACSAASSPSCPGSRGATSRAAGATSTAVSGACGAPRRRRPAGSPRGTRRSAPRPERSHGLGGELEVMGLHAGLGQRGHPVGLAADPLGRELQRVERGRDRHPPVVARVVGRAPGQQQCRCCEGDEGGLHDNDSHS